MQTVANKPVAALMNREIAHVDADTPLHHAMQVMRERKISSVLVMTDGRPVGIITERDLLHVLGIREPQPQRTCANLMQAPVITVDSQCGHLEAYHTMLEHDIRHLAVVNSDGVVVGMLSESDLVDELGVEYYLQFRDVGRVMSAHIACLAPVSNIGDALRLMDTERHSCVIVAGDDRIPQGIITERDMVRVGLDSDAPDTIPLHRIMSSPVATVTAATALHEAVARMHQAHIRRLVVIDAEGRAVGLLSYHDVTRGLESRYTTLLRQMVDHQLEELQRRQLGLNEKAFVDNVLHMSGSTALVAADLFGRIRFASASVNVMFGLAPDAMIGRQLDRVLGERQADHSLAQVLETLTLSDHYQSEFTRQTPRGMRFIETQWSLLRDNYGAPQGFLLVAHDITHRRRAETALRDSEERFHAIFNSVNDGIVVLDPKDGSIVDVNRRVSEMYGYDPIDLLRMNIDQLSAGYAPYDRQQAAAYMHRAGAGEAQTFEWPARHHDGSEFWVEITMRGATIAGADRILLSVRDIGERKQSEERLRHLNWALSALSRGNAALVHALSIEEMLDATCRAITDQDGYALAYIGMLGDAAARRIEIVASAGSAQRYLDGVEVQWDDGPLGRGPAGEAVRSNASVVFNDLLDNDAFAPWQAQARRHGIASNLTVPLRSDGSMIGVLSVYATVTDAFDTDEIRLFEELADDMGFGIDSRKTQEAYRASLLERERYAEKLRDTLEQTIGALSATLEKRDPYTAGHERRVADLAVAIGRELGLDDQRLHGLRLAGHIHDIGKVQIPSELLSKPSKLAPVEFELIKMHAEAGHDIIKDIDFPWPIAEMVWQHHEYLDGSGYPRHLTGDQMLPEAKILAVADVVEAMSSHRPYRPARGIEPALEEITRLRDNKLDPAAVDACLRLFHEKGYAFPD